MEKVNGVWTGNWITIKQFHCYRSTVQFCQVPSYFIDSQNDCKDHTQGDVNAADFSAAALLMNPSDEGLKVKSHKFRYGGHLSKVGLPFL